MLARTFRLLVAAAFLAIATSATAPANAEDDRELSLQWGLAKVRAAAAWPRSTGAGTTIAIVDSGVDLNHVEFAGRILPGADFTETGTPQDDCGHGTHVAGIAAAAAGNGDGGAGVAPKANILPVKVLSRDGEECSGTQAAEGIKWAADQGATVINISLGGDAQFILGPSFSGAVRHAWEKGSIVVASAGNNFVFPSGFNEEPALVVAGTDMNDEKAGYSSNVGDAQWGIAAPGGNGGPDETKDIYSTHWEKDQANAYAWKAGSSMAAPFVSGAAAVLRSLGLTKEQTIETLRATAVKGPCGPACGAGRLDVMAAVEAVPAAPPPPAAAPVAPAAAAPPKSRTASPRRPATPSAGRRATAGEPEAAPAGAMAPGPVVPDDRLGNPEAASPERPVGISEEGEQRPWSMVAFASSLLAIAGAWAAVATRRENAEPA